MSSNKSKQFYKGYCECLNEEDKRLYQNKYLKFVGFDPYQENVDSYTSDASQWPKVQFPDISMYLLHTTNSVTLEEMKNHKSMDSHTFLTSGHIKKTLVKKLEKNLVLILGMVKHSQRANDEYLYNWILARECGEILTAHCSCMAGLGESCSHVGAVLFLIDAGVSILKNQSCTDKLNQWLVPHVKQVPFKRACDIDFTSSKQRKKRLDRLLIEDGSSPSPCQKKSPKTKREVPATTEEELEKYFETLASSESNPVILSITSPYNKKFIPKSLDLPAPLSSLQESSANGLPLAKVLELGLTAKGKISVSKEDSEIIEKRTKAQSKSRDWFSQRAGRITASKLKAACKSNPSNPSVSLLKTICHPEVTFFSRATKWGTDNEEVAIKQYLTENENFHDNLRVNKSGFVINPKYPFMGASPDGVISCNCCGSGVLEIKCPYSAKDTTIDEFIVSKNSPLKFSKTSKEFKLDTTHAYYYQVQAQMIICNVQYSDFVIWSPQGTKTQRISPNLEFWTDAYNQAMIFFDNCVLPELICKYYSSKIPSNGIRELPVNAILDCDKEPVTFCYCGQGESDKMVACDNENCKLKWFHFKCLGIRKAPTTKFWYCRDCKELCGRPRGRPKNAIIKK